MFFLFVVVTVGVGRTAVDCDCNSSSSEGAWSAVVATLLKESQEDSDETDKCEACKSESDEAEADVAVDENSQSSSDSPNVIASSWWAELLKIHAKEFVVGHRNPDECNVFWFFSVLLGTGYSKQSHHRRKEVELKKEV